MKPLATPVLFVALLALPALAADLAVDQKNNKFDKTELAAKVGDTITFGNSDAVKHNLTLITPDEESKDLGTEGPGSNVKYVVSKPGVYDVRCSIHPGMKMKIKVQ